METVKIEVGVNLSITFYEIILPLLIAGIKQENIALPAIRQAVEVLVGSVRALENVPFRLDSVRLCIIKRSVAEIVEHAFHTVVMLHFDILSQNFGINLTVGNVIIYLIRMFHRSSEWPVVLVVPIVELDAVDVASAQKIHLSLDDSFFELGAVEVSDKAVTRESGPVA